MNQNTMCHYCNPITLMTGRTALTKYPCHYCDDNGEPQASLDNEHFLPLLRRVDDCLAYVASHPQYAESTTYATKFR